MTKKNDKAMEEDIKKLQKHMGGLVKTILDLKSKVEALEQKDSENQKRECEIIFQKKEIMDKAIAANSDAIMRIDKEIINLSKAKENISIRENLENEIVEEVGVMDDPKDENGESVDEISFNKKKCRYYNGGYCKFKNKCRYYHPGSICQSWYGGKKCCQKECSCRHPKYCKWNKEKRGCRRQNCAYLHEEEQINADTREFKCEGCKSVWNDKKHVVEHSIQNTKVYFCLNCEDWVKYKQNVFDWGWSLFDDGGNLRYDI